jgi:hypothetical protein
VLDSDVKSDEDYDPEGDSEVEFAWGDIYEDEVADLPADVSEDDALLRTARNRNVIKGWEADCWKDGKCEFTQSTTGTHILLLVFVVPPSSTPEDDYPNIFESDEWSPTHAVARLADAPLARFLFFFPNKLFSVIAEESQLYAISTLKERARKIQDRQKKEAVQLKKGRECVETRSQIKK